jgi:hypothetical protein
VLLALPKRPAKGLTAGTSDPEVTEFSGEVDAGFDSAADFDMLAESPNEERAESSVSGFDEADLANGLVAEAAWFEACPSVNPDEGD